MKNMMRRTVLLVFIFACTVLTEAATVHNTNNAGDSRNFTTGCKYSESFSAGAGSIGIWIKNITEINSGKVANLFGNLKPSETSSGGMMLYVNGTAASGEIRFRVEGTNADATKVRTEISGTGTASLLADGSWHFVFGTFDVVAGKVALYIDGVLNKEADTTITAVSPTRCFAGSCIGTTEESTTQQRDNYAAGYKGLFAEITLWNRSLLATEVSELATRRADPLADGLIGYWPMVDSKNAAFCATRRTDGTVPDALFYYPMTANDADFFANPVSTGRFVVAPAVAAAKGYTVPADCDYSSIVSPATSIQDAVNAAASGETVYVTRGTYPLTSRIETQSKKNVVIQSWDYTTGTNDRDGTIIDGQNACAWLYFNNTEKNAKQVVRGFTFTNAAPDATSIYFDGQTSYDTSASRPYVRLADSRISGCNLSNGHVVFLRKFGTVTNCFFSNCTCVKQMINSTCDNGDCSDSQIANEQRCGFVDCDIEDCTSTGKSIWETTNASYIKGCRFRRNHPAKGSAVVTASAGIAVRDSLFEDNAALEGTADSVVNLNQKHGSAVGLTLHGNTASYGIRALDVQTGNAYVDKIALSNNLFSSAALIGTMRVRNSLISNRGYCIQSHNKGNYGGFTVENSTVISGSTAVWVSGSGVTNTFVNSIVIGNTAGWNNAQNNCVTFITNSIISSVAGTPFKDTDGIENLWTRLPKFVNAGNGDYHLARGSFGRNKGVRLGWMDATTTDLDGKPRLVGKDGVPSPDAHPDLGCYESSYPPFGLILTVW